MKLAVGNEAPKGPNQPTQIPKKEIPSRSVYDFPVSVNPFQSLEESEPAVSTSQSQIQERLIDPRRTRLARQQAARRDVEQGTLGTLSSEGVFHTIPPVNDEQGIFCQWRM